MIRILQNCNEISIVMIRAVARNTSLDVWIMAKPTTWKDIYRLSNTSNKLNAFYYLEIENS